MGNASRTGLAAALAAAATLPGCAGPASEAPEPAAPPPVERTAQGDVLAPELFQASADGLWDGRPSLGGVWVAHPDVAEPERVLIASDGAEVTGALFRRDGEVVGPPFEVSSQAAAALGMLPGEPRALTVTALGRPEPDAPAAAPDAPSDPALAEIGASFPFATSGQDTAPAATDR